MLNDDAEGDVLAEAVDATDLLREDHEALKALFDDFETAESGARGELARRATHLLKIHSALEEELFYPDLRDVGDRLTVAKAFAEHELVERLAADLDRLDSEDEEFIAKFVLLAEVVRRHIDEEEEKLFSRAQTSRIDLEELGARMMRRRQELEENGVGEKPRRAKTRSSKARR